MAVVGEYGIGECVATRTGKGYIKIPFTGVYRFSNRGVEAVVGNDWVMIEPGDLDRPLDDATAKEIEEALKRITEPRQYPDGVTIAYEGAEHIVQRLFVWFYVGLTVGVAWYPKHREIILSVPFVTIQYKWGN